MIEGLKHDNFAIDGFRLPLADLKEKFPHLQYFVFGFPNTTAQNQLERCRKFDTENWTNEMTNEELLPVFNFLISESQELEKICREKDIPFFDTGDDYHAKIKQALALTK